MANDSDKHAYWANAAGFIAFFALLAVMAKSCDNVTIEREKTKQIEIIHGIKKSK
jgi:hypothetical protein